VILGGGDFCLTASVMTRRDLMMELPDYFSFTWPVGDYPMQIYLASCGETYYFLR
jgi:hypothetical protein